MFGWNGRDKKKVVLNILEPSGLNTQNLKGFDMENELENSTILRGEKLLRAEEVAQLLDISRSFAYNLIRTGEIPYVRLGKSCRVRPQDLADFIEKNLHGGD